MIRALVDMRGLTAMVIAAAIGRLGRDGLSAGR